MGVGLFCAITLAFSPLVQHTASRPPAACRLAMADVKKQVLVPIADGSEEIEAVCIIDTLVRAGAHVTVASVMDQHQVTCSRGVKIVADALIGDVGARTFDAIVIPGGMPGAEHLAKSEPLAALLKAQASAGRLNAAICAAPVVVLQKHGLLVGRKATAHPAFSDKLLDQAPVSERVVVDGNLVTSRGPGTALEFALAIVELLYDTPQAKAIANAMVVA